MNNLSQAKCANHAQREAVARCPGCGRFYCRECITEHQGQVLCTRCLARKNAPPRAPGHSSLMLGVMPFAGGVLLLWACFYYLGLCLSLLPEEFHEGTLWKIIF